MERLTDEQLPSDMPPVKYDGRTWIRTGPRRGIASLQDEGYLIKKRRYKNLPYDAYPVPSASVTDLSRAVFEEEYLPAAFAPDVLEENHRTYEEKLASCKMIVSPDDTTPTLTGLLAVGRKPQNFIPGAYIQFLRIAGNDLVDEVIDEERIEGALPEMVRRATEKLVAHNWVAMDITSDATHKISTPYPLAAVQQILYNAVMHRTYEHTNTPTRIYWYQNRIEIFNPGGPYGIVTPQNFGQPGYTDYRNPNLAAVMKTFGIVQSFGRGIGLARGMLEKNGNPPMEFDVSGDKVLCTIKNKNGIT